MPPFAPVNSQLSFPTIHRLPSGLTVIAEQMPVTSTTLHLWLRAGSAHESNDINGLAHFLEHMIFKGTDELHTGEFERRVEARGALMNAATSQDYTHYHLTTASQDFAELAPLQVQMVLNPRLNAEDFERERPVILEEIRQAEDSPRRRTFYRSMEMAFERLPYRRPVLGSTEVVEQLTPHQMRDFHRCWYQPQHMTAVAVGNLPVEELVQVVSESFAHLLPEPPPPTLDRFAPWPACQLESPFGAVRRAAYVDPTLRQARLVMGWRVPGMVDLQDTYDLDVAASILSQGRTSRLVRHLREEANLVSGISASNMTYGQQGVFYVAAQCAPEHLEAVEGAIATHIETLSREPVTEAELQRVRTQVANRYVFGSETPSDRANLYGYYHTLTGSLEHALRYPAEIRAVSALRIQAAAQQYLRPDAYGLVTMQPE